MILNVTEEQKKVIEEHGRMVIEFKKWCRDVFAVCIVDTWNAIIFYLQQFVERVLIPCVDKLVNCIKKTLAYSNGFIAKTNSLVERKKHGFAFVRLLDKKYRPNLSYKIIYHRCRDRC